MSRLSFIAILVAAFAVAPAAEASERIVFRTAGLSAAERADVRADADVTLERTLGIPGVEVVIADDVKRSLSELRADRDVVWAEPDRLRTAAVDPLAGLEWALDNTLDADIDAAEAWTISRGAGVNVAVVDSGVDLAHPDLASQLLPGYDWVGDDSVPQDGNGHGTHVAGTIAAAENGLGVVGVAPEASVIPLRVLGDNGAGWGSDVAAAFDWAGDRGVRIVNASLGADGITTLERLAIREHPGTLYVVAAGNDGDNVDVTPHYPCAYTEANVLCVGATDAGDDLASFSNYGTTAVDLFAPGVDIASTYPVGFGTFLDDGYTLMDGTSMATPHVAGAAALVAAHHPEFTASQIKAALMQGADLQPALAGKGQVAGRLNAAAALGVTPPAPTPTPTPTPTTPTTPVAPAPAAVGSLRVSGRVVLGRRTATLSFTASAATNVTVTLRGQGRSRQTTRAVSRGTTRWRITRSVAGLRLRPGRQQLTLTAPAGPASVAFTVRSR
jgi:thermitase